MQRLALDGLAVDELVVRPHRGDGRHFVDHDLARHFCPEHRHQGNGRIVGGGLVGGRLPALGNQVEARPLGGGGCIERKAAVGAAFRLRQSFRCAGAGSAPGTRATRTALAASAGPAGRQRAAAYQPELVVDALEAAYRAGIEQGRKGKKRNASGG